MRMAKARDRGVKWYHYYIARLNEELPVEQDIDSESLPPSPNEGNISV